MIGFVVALMVLALVIWLQYRTGRLLQYLYFCRFSLLVAAFLVGFPLLATGTQAASLFKNLFALLPRGISLVTCLALLASWVVMVTFEIFLRNGHLRFRVGEVTVPRWIRRLMPLLFAVLAVPLIWAALKQSSVHPPSQELWAVAKGALWALFCLIGAAVLHVLLLPLGAPGEDLILPGIGKLFGGLRRDRRPLAFPWKRTPPADGQPRRWPFEGYIDEGTGHIRPGHLLALAYFLVTLGFYIYYWNQGPVPADGRQSTPLPSLGYLLLVVILFGWALPAISFLLDRYRIPVLTLLIAASFLASNWAHTDHYYKIRKPETVVAAPTPDQIFKKDETREDREAVQRQYPIVIVAASGGGITASMWTAVVLTSLQREIGPEFTRSIRLISSVSGGSVGTMYFLDRFSGQRHPPAEALPGIVEDAGTTSLGSTAWGLAYPDLWRVFPGFVRNPLKDRGWAMEQSWRTRLKNKDATLGQWRQMVSAEKIPPVIFNSTEVETGGQFLFTPLAKPKESRWRARFFSEAHPGYDIPVVTAARLSAAFPWVSPMPRPCANDCGEEDDVNGSHLADGGYFDNYGIVSVINWMRSLSREERAEMRQHDVLVVLIRAFPEDGDAGQEMGQVKSEDKGWVYATVGPILTMYNVRNSVQDDRNSTELAMLEDLLKSELGVPGQGSGVNATKGKFKVARFVLTEDSPLSWKLTKPERDAIVAGWMKGRNQESLQTVKELFPTAPPSSLNLAR